MFNEFAINELIKDIQSVDSLNFMNYETDGKRFLFFIASEDYLSGYVEIIMHIMLKYDLITLAVVEESEELFTFETVTFNRFGVN